MEVQGPSEGSPKKCGIKPGDLKATTVYCQVRSTKFQLWGRPIRIQSHAPKRRTSLCHDGHHLTQPSHAPAAAGQVSQGRGFIDTLTPHKSHQECDVIFSNDRQQAKASSALTLTDQTECADGCTGVSMYMRVSLRV